MSVLRWIVFTALTYFAHGIYQKIQHSRKKAEFIRDRRRAAGIPDDDKRPFAVARADALSRLSQQRREGILSTPIKKRPSSSQSRSHSGIDHEAASRLSGIPGTLPGYLKDGLDELPASTSSHSRQAPRSPSPIKYRSIDRGSSFKSMKRTFSQTEVMRREAGPDSSPTTQHTRKRRHEASPAKSEAAGPSKAPKKSIPGTFESDPMQEVKDEEMSDALSATSVEAYNCDDEEAMDEGNESQHDEDHKASPSAKIRTLQSAARATAKKREADDLDVSDTEQSMEGSDDEDQGMQPHSSKRSRTVNKDIDPSSSLDFEIALPEEAMADFVPVLDTSPSKASKAKRQADTTDDRQPGEEWVDFEGLRWRIHPDTHELQRWSDVLDWRSKYRMPRDSLHPMAKETHQVVVHKWLSKDEWEDAKAKKLLSFQESERLAEKEKLDKEEADKMRRKQEVLAKIRQTSSPNKRIQSYLAQQQRRQLQHKLSRGDLSRDVSMSSFASAGDGNSDVASMSIDSMSASTVRGEGDTPGKPRSKRISLHSRLTPVRGRESGSPGTGATGRESGSTSGASSPSSPNRRRNSPLASPYRPIQYPKGKKNGTPATSSPLVTSTFPPPPTAESS